MAAGFGSVRRFNDVFKRRYRLTPSDLRKRGRREASPEGTVTLRIGYRPPYRFEALLGFFRARMLQGVEVVGNDFYARTVRIPLDSGGEATGWVRVSNDAERNALSVLMSESLLPATSQVMARLRRQFDTDCNPHAVYEGIASLNETVSGAAVVGTRLPGCFDGFETAVRAVLGQQVSVAAANKLAARIVATCGIPIDTGIEGLERVFPTPDDILALRPIEEALGELGVIKARARTIAEVARLLACSELDFNVGAVVSEQTERLLAVKGIGPWTANYLAMRVLGSPDAFLETDAGIKHALPGLSPSERLRLAEQWRPWRSYATIALWNSLST